MERMERGVESPVLQHLVRKCRFFTTAINPNHSQCNYFAFECNKSWNVSQIMNGVSRVDDDVIVEFGNNKNCRIPMQKAAIAQIEKPGAE